MTPRTVVRLARFLVGHPPPKETGDDIAARMPPFLADANPLDSDDGFAARQRAAMKLLDGDCHGFLLLTVHRDGSDVKGRIELEAALQPHWHPAVARTLERVVDQVA